LHRRLVQNLLNTPTTRINVVHFHTFDADDPVYRSLEVEGGKWLIFDNSIVRTQKYNQDLVSNLLISSKSVVW